MHTCVPLSAGRWPRSSREDMVTHPGSVSDLTQHADVPETCSSSLTTAAPELSELQETFLLLSFFFFFSFSLFVSSQSSLPGKMELKYQSLKSQNFFFFTSDEPLVARMIGGSPRMPAFGPGLSRILRRGG